jgi:hypothetical protein
MGAQPAGRALQLCFPVSGSFAILHAFLDAAHAERFCSVFAAFERVHFLVLNNIEILIGLPY